MCDLWWRESHCIYILYLMQTFKTANDLLYFRDNQWVRHNQIQKVFFVVKWNSLYSGCVAKNKALYLSDYRQMKVQTGRREDGDSGNQLEHRRSQRRGYLCCIFKTGESSLLLFPRRQRKGRKTELKSNLESQRNIVVMLWPHKISISFNTARKLWADL